MCVKYFAKFTEKHLCWSLAHKKEIPTKVLSCKLCEMFKNIFFTFPVVASVILLSWLWNHFQSQQQKIKVRFVGSFHDGMARISVEASSFGWFLGGFRSFLLVAGNIGWFQLICYFSSSTNFTTFTRVISLLYSWTHVIDWGHSIF